MPVTRSQKGAPRSTGTPVTATEPAGNPPTATDPAGTTHVATESSGNANTATESSGTVTTATESSGTGTTELSSATATTTTGTGTTATGTTESESTAQHTEAGKADAPVQTSPPRATETEERTKQLTTARSHRSKKSKSSARLQRAKIELLRLQVELAAARVATLEKEENTDIEDDDTIISEPESQRRVADWIDDSQRRSPLAIADQPHREPSIDREREPPSIVQHGQPTPHTCAPDATHRPTAVAAAAPTVQNIYPAPAPATVIEERPPTIVQNVNQASAAVIEEQQSTAQNNFIAPYTSSPAGEAALATRQQLDISELAAAIALAAKSGQVQQRNFVDLPFYSGSYQEWLSFKAAYTETAASYTDTENIARLRKCLRGRARETVNNLLIYKSKPEDVMKTLETRFGRPDAIALSELERLRALPRLSDNPKDLCIFASRVSNIVATLQALEKIYYLFNPEVTKITIEKLTPAMRYRWFDFAAETKTQEPDLLKLARFLEREAERCSPYAPPEHITPTDTTGHVQRRPIDRTYTTAVPQKNKIACPVCNKEGHTTSTCDKFKREDVNSRWEIAKNKSLCFKCLNSRTRSHNCRGKRCDTDGCHRWHHQLLHFVRTEKTSGDTKTETVASTWAPANSRTFLKILPLKVSGPRGSVDTFALLDDGSTVTLIDSDIAKRIGARGPIRPLHIEAIADTEVSADKSRRVIITLQGGTSSCKIRANTINNLQLMTQGVSDEDLAGCEHLNDIQEHLRYRNVKPKVLIGQDNWNLLLAIEVRKGQKHQPVASLTQLGWVLHGICTRSLGQQIQYVNHIATAEDNMDEQLKHHFALESLTITPKRPQNDPEERALKILNECTKETENGRYETALLWKQDNCTLPNNYENAVKRLHSTENKIDRNVQLKQKYEEQMNALIEKGYAERAPPTTSNKVWYLPHFPVLNAMKPGKVRVVHDAAAKTRGVSLNDHLLTGPDLLQSLPGVLMRLRQHPIAVSADIAEMFMQVKIRTEDRDALRYLWRGDRRGNHTPEEYRMTSLIFGATSSPATAIFVKNKNAEKHRENNPEAYEAIVRNHYVDDYLQSFDTVERAIKIARDVRDIHSEAHFELRQWTSNSTEVLTALGVTTEQKTIDLHDGTQTERVLGLVWKPGTDDLAFNLNLKRLPQDILDSKRPTKRQALKIMMSLFDPLGLASPVTIRAKQILQEIWRRGTDWDKPIDDDVARQWTDWMEHLKRLRDVAVPRCYLHYTDAAEIQLHIFTDASEAAYTAALYWRVTTPDGEVATSLVLAKAKVAPLKTTSIPRLELQAAVMGSRMAAAVIEEHDRKPESKTFWTDSKTVLTWIRTGSRTYRPYVAHRIAAIEENSTVNEWRWVPTKQNVADDATRDVPRDLSSQHRWFRGPEFLRQDPSEWPSENHIVPEPTGEEKIYVVSNKNSSSITEGLPDSTRFSKWEKLLRTTARVIQFIQLCRRKTEKIYYKRTKKNTEKDPDWKRQQKKISTKPQVRPQNTDSVTYRKIEASLLRKAELLLVRAIQRESFRDEIKDLQNGKIVSTDSRLRPLSVELIDGMIRIKTRIEAATDITENVKKPIVLDGNHRITKLYIEYVHRQLQHAGVETTINECKQQYWIIRIRPVTRMIIHRCLPCRMRRDVPPTPPTGDLPRCRLAHHRRPFTYVGIDYFGPLTVTTGRTKQKRYVALFTCLTTRGVHLEIASSLSTDSAVMALRRMIARRGHPTEIWSDNGTNLRGADKELRKAIDTATEEEATKRTISWRYIPPGSPFMGGAWERLVRSVKTALNTVLVERHPTEEVLATLLAEAEYTVNSRPLTHVSVDPDDPEALTPNHFILGGSARVPPPGTFDDSDLIGRTHWRASQRLADMFWSRWIREYLPELQYRREPHGKGPALRVGDVVLIADGTLPRNTWPRGVVIETFPGPDGVVRTADIRTKGGVLRRPTKKIVILDTEPAIPAPDLECDDRSGRRTAGEMCRTTE